MAFCVALWSFQTSRCVLSPPVTFLNASAAETARPSSLCDAIMPYRPLFSAAARPYPAEAGHVASDVRRRALAAPSVLARRPPPPEHHCPRRAALRRNFYILRGGIMAKIASCRSPSRGKWCCGTGLLQGSVCTWFGGGNKASDGALCADRSVADCAASRLALRKRREGIRGERFLSFGQLWRPREPKELIELSILAGFQSSGTFRSIRMILFHDQNVSVRG